MPSFIIINVDSKGLPALDELPGILYALIVPAAINTIISQGLHAFGANLFREPVHAPFSVYATKFAELCDTALQKITYERTARHISLHKLLI
jgi:hypothetical protein